MLDLFLVAKNPSDYIEGNNKNVKYNNLNERRVYRILKHYEKKKVQGLPEIRKSEHVDPLLKKLKKDGYE
jgi:hypothetical protein